MSKIGDVIVKMLLKSDDYEKGLARSKKSTQSFAQTITKGFTAAIGKVAALVGAIVGIAKALDSISKANQAFGDKGLGMSSRGRWHPSISLTYSPGSVKHRMPPATSTPRWMEWVR